MCPKDTADLTLGIVLVHNTYTRKREIVLIQDRRKTPPRYWKFPGGSMQTGESPYDAIVREVREETTIVLPTQQPKGAYIGSRTHVWSNSMQRHFSVHVFAFTCNEQDIDRVVPVPCGIRTEHNCLKVARIPIQKLREGRIHFLPQHAEHLAHVAPVLHAALFSV
jgi:8-oxo-dGTP pyrophosphatase MutT (NUDIX family)